MEANIKITYRYRLELEIYYEDAEMNFPVSFIDYGKQYLIQQMRFSLQTEYKRRVAGIFINKKDIEKHNIQ